MSPGPEGAFGFEGDDDAIATDGDQTPVSLDPKTIEVIGEALQTFYRALIEEPLPARLLALLEMEAKEGGGA